MESLICALVELESLPGDLTTTPNYIDDDKIPSDLHYKLVILCNNLLLTKEGYPNICNTHHLESVGYSIKKVATNPFTWLIHTKKGIWIYA